MSLQIRCWSLKRARLCYICMMFCSLTTQLSSAFPLFDLDVHAMANSGCLRWFISTQKMALNPNGTNANPNPTHHILHTIEASKRACSALSFYTALYWHWFDPRNPQWKSKYLLQNACSFPLVLSVRNGNSLSRMYEICLSVSGFFSISLSVFHLPCWRNDKLEYLKKRGRVNKYIPQTVYSRSYISNMIRTDDF